MTDCKRVFLYGLKGVVFSTGQNGYAANSMKGIPDMHEAIDVSVMLMSQYLMFYRYSYSEIDYIRSSKSSTCYFNLI